MKTEQAIEKLKMLKAIIEKMNSEMIILITTSAQIEIIIKQNNPSVQKYPLLESKVNLLIENYKNLIK